VYCTVLIAIRPLVVLLTLLVFCSQVAVQIRKSFEDLAEEVRRRRDTLLSELETTHSNQQMSLARQADCLENLLCDVTNCCRLTQSALQHGNETEVAYWTCHSSRGKVVEVNLYSAPWRTRFPYFNADLC